MQIGIGGRATDNWDTIVSEIPPNLPGGTQPPSVYNETDAVYGAAALLKKWGAPGNWQAALVAWNNYPPEIAQVTQLVAQYTQTAQGQGGAPATTTSSTAPIPAGGQGCVPVSGPMTPGAVAKVLPNGLAEIPQGAPAAVQEMIAAGNQIISYPYSWGGGHSPASMRVPPGPSADPGQQENGGPGYDCSSAVSFVLWGGGLGQSLLGGQVPTSWTLRTPGCPAPANGSRSTPAPPPGKATRSSRSPGSCSTPSTAHPPPRPAPARAGSPPPRSATSSQAARSSPAIPKAYDPPPPAPASSPSPASWLSLAAAARHTTTSGATRRARRRSATGPAAPQPRCSRPPTSGSSTARDSNRLPDATPRSRPGRPGGTDPRQRGGGERS